MNTSSLNRACRNFFEKLCFCPDNDDDGGPDRNLRHHQSNRNYANLQESHQIQRRQPAPLAGHQTYHSTSNQSYSKSRSYLTQAEKDVLNYLQGYPGKLDNPDLQDNYLFYSNVLKCRPDNMTIDDIHTKWWGQYGILEQKHGYIQWLFPIRESGMNWEAQELQIHEAQKICQDVECQNRVVRSYKLILDFYGMKLKKSRRTSEGDDRCLAEIYTGELELGKNWQARFSHLNRSSHNYLRITRVLKCLGELGLDHFQAPFVHFVLDQIFQYGELKNCLTSCKDYWLPVIRDERRKQSLLKCYFSGNQR